MLDRNKVKEGITEELSDEQKASFNETLEKSKKLLEDIRKVSNYTINVKYGKTIMNTINTVKEDIGYNFIIIKHEYDISLEKTSKLFVSRNKLLYVNVPRLIIYI